MSLSPAARIATTVAKAMAERGDDVGPNVTLVLLAELEASQARTARLHELLRRWLMDADDDGVIDPTREALIEAGLYLPAPTGKEER